MRTPIRTVGAFGGSTEVPIYPPDCLTYGPFRDRTQGGVGTPAGLQAVTVGLTQLHAATWSWLGAGSWLPRPRRPVLLDVLVYSTRPASSEPVATGPVVLGRG